MAKWVLEIEVTVPDDDDRYEVECWGAAVIDVITDFYRGRSPGPPTQQHPYKPRVIKAVKRE